jgi:hypothetical protein
MTDNTKLSAAEFSGKKPASPLSFLGRVTRDDWRRALILAEILAPPLARRALPESRRVLGKSD